METRNLITTQQRMLSATPTGMHNMSGSVTPNSGTPKQGRTVTQQDIRMMLGRGKAAIMYRSFRTIFALEEAPEIVTNK